MNIKEIVKSVYWNLQPVHIAELFIGTKARELEWTLRKFRKEKGYCGINHSHRDLLCQKIASYNPKSILEIGCNEGQNLFRLAKMLPDCEIIGIDINEDAIDSGDIEQDRLGIKNVTLVHSDMNNFFKLVKGKFDVVFTDATLMYIGKDKISEVLLDIKQITNRAMIFCEWNLLTGGSEYYRGGWLHDYSTYCDKICNNTVKMTKITKDIWNDKIWANKGAIIEVVL